MSNSRRYEAKPEVSRSGGPRTSAGDRTAEPELHREERRIYANLTHPFQHQPASEKDVALAHEAPVAASPIVFAIDGDVYEDLNLSLEGDGITVRSYATCEDFLAAYRPGRTGCLLIDASVPGMGCLELIRQLGDLNHQLPVIMMTGDHDVSIVVKAMKAGVLEFIEKPVDLVELLAAVHRVLRQAHDTSKAVAWHQAAAGRIATLTPRQRQVLLLILRGSPNKNIAADLGVSQRTVESHRAAIMRKTGSHSLPELARLAIAASTLGEPATRQQDDPPTAR